ncbi:MAG: 16S rRNA (guanine(966)-N(2))-methyltransferase RsmD [Clostridiales bacterium]|nr:16S rRNA (guanine(966)-N(2))-methyltransferase RsmD [Clostridiales bacterium]
MRIISGERRGHKLHDFDGSDIRPTTDRVKESIFNLISDYVPDALVLDMFCGSGALSLEALSRGAAGAVCIDRDKRAAGLIRKNVCELDYGNKCEILNMDCMEYAKNCRKCFDIIFLDPPYNKGFIEPALDMIVKNGMLSEDGIAVLESDDTDFCGDIDGLSVIKQRKYGRTYITIYALGERTNENSSISGKL